MHTSFCENIAESRAFPSAIHHGAVAPVYAADFFDEGPHCAAAVAGTLESTRYFVLGELGFQLEDRQFERLVDKAINVDPVARSVYVRDGAVVAIVIAFDGDEAVLVSNVRKESDDERFKS